MVDKGRTEKELEERSTTILMRGMRLIAVYQPLWNHGREALEEYRHGIENQIAFSNSKEILIIGGDHNAHVGGNCERNNTSGKYGLRHSNEAGEDLLNWCDIQNLAHANSFWNHGNRRTWFSNIHKRWYELDGFLLKKDQRHKVLRKINTAQETTLSDHKPKIMTIRIHTKTWKYQTEDEKKPRIAFDALKTKEVAEVFKEITSKEADRRRTSLTENGTNWNELSSWLMKAAKEACGLEKKTPALPWLTGREKELQHMRVKIKDATNLRYNKIEEIREHEEEDNIMGRLFGNAELETIKTDLKKARKDLKKKLKMWEEEWWKELITKCENECVRGNMGGMYKILRSLETRKFKGPPSSTTLTTENFKEQFSKISNERYELSINEIDTAVGETEDRRNMEGTKEMGDFMNETPTKEEIIREMKNVKDSSPGQDGVRITYILNACQEILDEIIKMVQYMFTHRANSWEESLKQGSVIPLFKKGDRNDANNYRGVCLLSMGSRIHARILAARLRLWAETKGLVKDNQCGFRPGRSTADATQIFMRIQEDITDYNKRITKQRNTRKASTASSNATEVRAILLDLQKAYPRINKPCLWSILRRSGLTGNCLNTIMDLHETTEYSVKGKEGNSSKWKPERGLREGCPTSPTLFNIYHQQVMIIAEKERKEAARLNGVEAGIEWKYNPSGGLPGLKMWEKYNSETRSHYILTSLFADDTTIIGNREELEQGNGITKEVMARFEEKNNAIKEEELIFGDECSNKVRMLGCWMGPKHDLDMRIRRAGQLWFRVKNRLFETTLSKTTQAKIVEACVESALLFDAQTRTWWVKDYKRLQSWMDRCYRYIWSSKKKPPLIEMQERHTNMQDVRNSLKIRSIRYKIEKRMFERIGHVLRMDNNRLTKIVTLGWYAPLELTNKCPGKKRKTLLYWRGLLREAGTDISQVEEKAQDRRGWRKLVNTRMEEIESYERQSGNQYKLKEGEVKRMIRSSERRNEDKDCLKCGTCDKLCKSKGGLTIHKKRMHKPKEFSFTCGKCGEVLYQEANKVNHEKWCVGTTAKDKSKKKCATCGIEVDKTNFARHRKKCEGQGRGEGPSTARVYKKGDAACPNCGIYLSKTNMARHRGRCEN
jgi:hypothetical protein